MIIADKNRDYRLKILIADDEEDARVMLSQLVSYMGHQAVLACNGLEAVQLFESERPDIILMDVMMPELDGYKATARIRQIQTEKWVPVVFLSALERNGNLLKGLEAGGDDYIAKPINLSELQVKIRALQRVAVLQENLAEKRRQLESYFQQSEEDARIGSHIMDRLISMPGLKDDALKYWTRPLQRFSGDLVAAARTPGNVLYVMLADAVGHGLPAALNVLPLADTFYGMTADGFPLARIITELDIKIKQLFPVDRFVAATLVSIDEYSREIQVWNGGNPAPIFVSAGGQVRRLEKSRQLPLGLLQDHASDTQPETMVYQEEGQIILCSDGLYEAQAADGTFWCCAGIYDALASVPPAERLTYILDEFKRHLGDQPVHDDVSLMLVDVSYNTVSSALDQAAVIAPILPQENSLGWKVEFTFGAREIKTLDVIPFLTTIVEKLEPNSEYRRQIFMILSELFNNALEHGLLQLDSNMKSTFDGFDAYMHERSSRLHALDEGSIEVTLEGVIFNGRSALKIYVKDSGSGFNYSTIKLDANLASRKTHGRGILLANSLSIALQYLGTGNEVVSYCPL